MIRSEAKVEDGFTLVEVLVALVITALLGAILIDGATIAGRRTKQAEQRRQAVFMARSLLATAATELAEVPSRDGTTNGLHWQVLQAPLMIDPRGRIVLVGMVARIKDASDHLLFEAESRRLKQAPAR